MRPLGRGNNDNFNNNGFVSANGASVVAGSSPYPQHAWFPFERFVAC